MGNAHWLNKGWHNKNKCIDANLTMSTSWQMLPDIECSEVVLMNTAHFIDEELTSLYEKPAFYNIATKEDLVGQLVIGLAPHTSAGIIGRIIGFSNFNKAHIFSPGSTSFLFAKNILAMTS